jgi:hypothetical protein
VRRIGGWIGDTQGSCRIIDPRGDVIAEAPVGEEAVLTASVSLEAVLQAKAYYDVGGHYSRPDVLQLQINRRPLQRVVDRTDLDSIQLPVVVAGANASLGTHESARGNERQTETRDAKGS